MSGRRVIRAPRGDQLSCKGWHQEAAMRMLMNNLDPDVAENPDQLIVYGGTGRAARSWEAFDAIVRSLRELENDESLLVQSGKPIGKFRTHDEAPRVLIANSNLVGQWNNYAEFNRLERLGLTMYGQMTAGSWIYIGSQGIVQGTFETFAAAGRKTDQPTNSQSGATRGPHFNRHLVVRTAHTAALHFQGRFHVVDSFLEQLDRIILGPIFNLLQRAVEHALSH